MVEATEEAEVGTPTEEVEEDPHPQAMEKATEATGQAVAKEHTSSIPMGSPTPGSILLMRPWPTLCPS